MKHPSHVKTQLKNHPQKGSSITVDPIRNLEDIESIKNLLKDNPRDYLLFVMGINNGLRTGDLLKLRNEMFKNAEINQKIPIKEEKTGKPQEIVINSSVKDALDGYFAKFDGEYEYLFQSTRGFWPISVPVVNRMIKNWCKKVGLKGNFGSHTLRKTFGYVLRRHHKVPWELISKRYNHSSPAVTRNYLGIQDEEVNDIILKYPI